MSNASFVKRSKPRSSASRISAAYDDDENVEAGPSSSFTRVSSAKGSTTGSCPSSDQEAVDDGGYYVARAPNVVFRARAKGVTEGQSSPSTAFSSRTGTGRSPAPSLKQRPSVSAMDEDKAEDDGDAFEIRRSKPTTASTQSKRSTLVGSSLSAASTATPKRSTPLRPTSFQLPPDTADILSDASSSLYTSKYLEELRSSTSTARSRAHSPAAAQTTGPGTRIDDPMVTQSSRIELDDPTYDTLARTKFAADFAHDAIPSESVIRAAKEKGAKLRAAAASSSEDFISLAPISKSSALKRYNVMQVNDGPHPHSRLQREEDELGDGEDEFAEYTGATERIPIGEKAEREWQERQRREMEAAVRGDFDQDGVVEVEMDEDEEEWERAQLRRTQAHPGPPSHPQSREASPFRPAPIPASAPLPSISTCSTRLELTLRELEQSIAASAAVLDSAAKELETLDAAERVNKLDVAAVEDKASWFNELDEFVASLARFMEEKMREVEEVEKRGLELLVRRNRMAGRRRGRWLDGRLGVCLGYEPTASAVVVVGEEEEEQQMDAVGSQVVYRSQLDRLEAADEVSFSLAQQEIVDTLVGIFADVRAPEYLDPAATVAATGAELPFLSSQPQDGQDLHPRSVVSRFEEWRRRYPEEYAQVWGGLSVAQIWEFYARLELIAWSPFESGGEWREGSRAIAHFRWFTGASDYTSRAGGAVGGDDEVLSSIVANVLVSHLIKLASQGAYLPWSERQTREAVEAVDCVQTVLGVGHARCLSLGEAFADVWKMQVGRLRDVVRPQMGEARAGREVMEELVVLLKNLVAWLRVFSTTGGWAETPTGVLARSFIGLVESLVLDVIQPLTVHLATGSGELAQDMTRQVLEVIPQHIVAKSDRLSLLTRT